MHVRESEGAWATAHARQTTSGCAVVGWGGRVSSSDWGAWVCSHFVLFVLVGLFLWRRGIGSSMAIPFFCCISLSMLSARRSRVRPSFSELDSFQTKNNHVSAKTRMQCE